MSLALFLAGFSTFSLLYCVQPLLPAFAEHFAVTPAQSALALSLTTGALAVAIIIASAFSQGVGRRGLMFASMALAAIMNILAAMAPSWPLLLLARTLEGLLLGGVPAVAMAYLAEETEPRDLGGAMGLYVAGTAFGSMMGRVAMGILSELGSWQMALAVIGFVGLVAALAFIQLLPPSRHFVRQQGLDPRFHFKAWANHLQSRPLLKLFGIGFTLTGVFATVFNYVGFRLQGDPYRFSQSEGSLLFLVFAFGIVSSSLSGRLTDRFGRRRLLSAAFAVMLAGVALTLARALPILITGIALITIGFFVAHAVAGSWVGRLAAGNKGHAASLYLLFFYVGSSVIGVVGGWFWQYGAWLAVAALIGVLAAAGGMLGRAVESVGPK